MSQDIPQETNQLYNSINKYIVYLTQRTTQNVAYQHPFKHPPSMINIFKKLGIIPPRIPADLQKYHQNLINRFQATNRNNTKQLRSELPSPQRPKICQNPPSVFGSNPSVNILNSGSRVISMEEPDPTSCSLIPCNDTAKSKLPALRISVHHIIDLPQVLPKGLPHNPSSAYIAASGLETVSEIKEEPVNRENTKSPSIATYSSSTDAKTPCGTNPAAFLSPTTTTSSPGNINESNYASSSSTGCISPASTTDYQQLSPINVQQSRRNTFHRKNKSKETEDEVLREIENMDKMNLMREFKGNTGQYRSSQNCSNNNNSTNNQSNNRSNSNNDNNGNHGDNGNNGCNQNNSGNGSGGNNGGRKGRDDNDDNDEEKKQNDKQMDDDDEEEEEEEEEKKNDDGSSKHKERTKCIGLNEFELNGDAPCFIPSISAAMPTIHEEKAMFTASKSEPMPSIISLPPKESKYDPNPLHRVKGNIQISRRLTTDIIPKAIKEQIKNIYDYIDKSTAIATYHGNHFDDGNIRVFNLDFHDEKSDEILYLVADRQDENISKHRNYKYMMRQKLFTKDELYDLVDMTENDAPKSSRNKEGVLINDIDAVNDIFSNAAALCQNVIFKTKWHRIPIFNITNNNKQYNKQRLTFFVTKTEFIDAVERFVYSDNNNKALVPIVMFNKNGYHIEYVQIVEIRDNIHIGISYIYHSKYGIKATGIHLNKSSMFNQHQLISPNHVCHCLDGFRSDIDDLHIGNPDDDRNRAKDCKMRNDILKNENKDLKDTVSDLKSKMNGLGKKVIVFKVKMDGLQGIINRQQHIITQLNQTQSTRSIHSVTSNISPIYTPVITPSLSTSYTLPCTTPQSVRSISSISEHSTTFSEVVASASNAAPLLTIAPIIVSQSINYNQYVPPNTMHNQLPPAINNNSTFHILSAYKDGAINETNQETKEEEEE